MNNYLVLEHNGVLVPSARRRWIAKIRGRRGRLADAVSGVNVAQQKQLALLSKSLGAVGKLWSGDHADSPADKHSLSAVTEHKKHLDAWTKSLGPFARGH
jgi:hypothetical protein